MCKPREWAGVGAMFCHVYGLYDVFCDEGMSSGGM